MVVAALPTLPQEEDTLPIRPDPNLTPGLIASTDPEDVCGKVDGLTYSQPTKPLRYKGRTTRDFEVDHRVPLCIGGADDEKNLWPQEGWQHPNSPDKDRLEDLVRRAVCRTQPMTLPDGRAAIFMGDWIAGFERVFGQPRE